MEILSTTTHWGEYWFLIIVIATGIFLAGSFVIGILLDDRDPVLVVLLTIILVIGIALIVDVVKTGPDQIYLAKIHDFNEVYQNGYEIVDRDGKLYTLRESEVK